MYNFLLVCKYFKKITIILMKTIKNIYCEGDNLSRIRASGLEQGANILVPASDLRPPNSGFQVK